MNAVIRSVLKVLLLTVFLLSVVWLLLPSLLGAAACHAFTHVRDTPSGYAPAVRYFTDQILIRGDCTDSSITATIGDGADTTFIYKDSYYWTGEEWIAVPVTGQTVYNLQPEWFVGQATANIPSTQGKTFYVAYTCDYKGGEMRCGCVDASCTRSYWQIQQFVRTQTYEVPPYIVNNPGGGGGATGGGYQGGNGIDQCPLKNNLFLNPFNRDSAHHRPIGTGAQYAGDDHPATQNWKAYNSFAVNVGSPFGGTPIKTNASDPLRTVAWTGRSTGLNLPAQFRLPNGFDPGGQPGRDNVITILDSSENYFNELYEFNVTDSGYTASINRKYTARGLGHGASANDRQGVTATGVGLLFGLLRGEEINTPGHPIRHALQIAIPGHRQPYMLSRQVMLPASSKDGFCTEGSSQNVPSHCGGNIPYGALFAIPPSINIDDLNLSEPGKRLAQAIQQYGMYVVDDAANPAMRTDQHVSASVRQQLAQDIPKIYPLMRMVLNSAWTSGQATVGGGTPLAPNCAFDAPVESGGGSGSGGGTGTISGALCAIGTGATRSATPSTLASVLANAGAGTVVELASGTYGGTYTLSKNGSASNPIHIKKAAGANPVVSGKIVLNGNYARLEGITFNGGEVVVGGNYNRVTKNTFRNFDQPAVQITDGGSNNRVDHNEMSHLKQNGSGYGVQIKLSSATGNAKANIIDHNYIHDFTGWRDNGHEGIQVGQGTVSSDWDTETLIIRNLLDKVDVDDEAISIKSSGSHLEGNTFLNSNAFLSSRHGRNHTWKGNYSSNSQGFVILGADHLLEGNMAVGGNGIRLMAGSITQSQLEATRPAAEYARAENVVVRNNTANIVVGYDNWSDKLPALNNTLSGNKGSVTFEKHSGTNNQGAGAGATVSPLSPNQVGPNAGDLYCQ